MAISMGSRWMLVLLEAVPRGYINVSEVGCREPSSSPWNRLPSASYGEEGEGRVRCGARRCSTMHVCDSTRCMAPPPPQGTAVTHPRLCPSLQDGLQGDAGLMKGSRPNILQLCLCKGQSRAALGLLSSHCL